MTTTQQMVQQTRGITQQMVQYSTAEGVREKNTQSRTLKSNRARWSTVYLSGGSNFAGQAGRKAGLLLALLYHVFPESSKPTVRTGMEMQGQGRREGQRGCKTRVPAREPLP